MPGKTFTFRNVYANPEMEFKMAEEQRRNFYRSGEKNKKRMLNQSANAGSVDKKEQLFPSLDLSNPYDPPISFDRMAQVRKN